MIDIEHSEMIAIDVSEAHLGLVSGLFKLARSNENLRHGEHTRDAQDLVRAVEVAACHNHFGELRVERELGHHGS